MSEGVQDEVKKHSQELTLFGFPKAVPDATREIDKRYSKDIRLHNLNYYASGYDKRLKMCRWSLTLMHKGQFSGNYPPAKDQDFLENPGVPSWTETKKDLDFVTLKAPTGNRLYNRGHMAASTDVIGLTQDIRIEALLQRGTYFMENIAPQLITHNHGVWLTFEETIRKVANEMEKLWVLSGPVVSEKASRLGLAFVPSSFFKILIGFDAGVYYVGAIKIPSSADVKSTKLNWEPWKCRMDLFSRAKLNLDTKHDKLVLPFDPFPKFETRTARKPIEDIWQRFDWDDKLQKKWKSLKSRIEKYETPVFRRPTRVATSPADYAEYSENKPPRAPSPFASSRLDPSERTPGQPQRHLTPPNSRQNSVGRQSPSAIVPPQNEPFSSEKSFWEDYQPAPVQERKGSFSLSRPPTRKISYHPPLHSTEDDETRGPQSQRRASYDRALDYDPAMQSAPILTSHFFDQVENSGSPYTTSPTSERRPSSGSTNERRPSSGSIGGRRPSSGNISERRPSSGSIGGSNNNMSGHAGMLNRPSEVASPRETSFRRPSLIGTSLLSGSHPSSIAQNPGHYHPNPNQLPPFPPNSQNYQGYFSSGQGRRRRAPTRSRTAPSS